MFLNKHATIDDINPRFIALCTALPQSMERRLLWRTCHHPLAHDQAAQ
jgi:hypothetical protein